MKKILFILFLISPFFLIGQDYVKNEILIQLTPKTDAVPFLRKFCTSHQLDINSAELISKPMNIYLVKFNQNINHTEVISLFKSQKEVLNIQNNHLVTERETIPNDPDFVTEQWYLKNTGQTGGTVDADIDATDAWDISTGGLTTHNDTIVVCIIEGNGVDIYHEDIKDNIWKNYAEIPSNGIDDDNNGYVDDYFGWNVISNDDVVGNGSHGTRVAGMIGAVGNNGIGISGVNQQVKMMIVKGQQASNEASVIAAYTYPLEMRRKYNQTNGTVGAFVIATNSSWGIDGGDPANSPLWCAMYDTLGQAGIINIGATTNDNANVDVVGDLPTTCPSEYLIAVTMTNSNDVRPLCGYGPINVDLAAPGFGVYLPVPTDIYTSSSGTSFATPCVTGSVALLYSTPCPDFINFTKAYPDSAALKVRAYILNNVDPKMNLTGDVATGGRLNINNSMLNVLSDCNTGNCIAPYNLSISNLVDTAATINWNGFSTDFLFYLQEENKPLVEHPFSNITNLTIDTLTPCTNYTIYVKSVCSVNDTSVYSYPIRFKTDGCCDNPPLFMADATDSTLKVQWQNILYATDYTLRYKLTTENNWTEILSSNSIQTITNLDSCTEYEFQIKTTCTDSTHGYSNSYIFKTKGCGACYDLTYCDVDGANSTTEWIESINFNGIIHTTGNNGGWLTETNVIFSALPNSSSQISITPGYSGVNYTENFTVWVDTDQNGIFDLSDKLLTGLSNNGSVNGLITLPSGTLNGITKMRIGMTAINQPTECPNSSFYGEFEDYCFYIGPDAGIGNSDKKTELSIYPNPTNTTLFINSAIQIQKVDVLSIDGKIISTQTLNCNQISVTNLPNGIYLVKIYTDQQIKTLKFIKN
jgi:hypothetical protein